MEFVVIMNSTNNLALELTNISLGFEGTVALKDVSIAFKPGTVSCVVGPNGAGKTTLFGVASGYLKPDSGNVFLGGREITGGSPTTISRLGIGRLFQDVRAFSGMTLLENVAASKKNHPGDSLLSSLIWPLVGSQAESENLKNAMDHLSFVGLAEYKDALAQNVSYGQQKLTAIARLMNNEAECFLLDEPTAGLSDIATKNLLSTIRKLAELGKTVVVIEHSLRVVQEIGDIVFLLKAGEIVSSGNPSEILGSYFSEL